VHLPYGRAWCEVIVILYNYPAVVSTSITSTQVTLTTPDSAATATTPTTSPQVGRKKLGVIIPPSHVQSEKPPNSPKILNWTRKTILGALRLSQDEVTTINGDTNNNSNNNNLINNGTDNTSILKNRNNASKSVHFPREYESDLSSSILPTDIHSTLQHEAQHIFNDLMQI
jgi:hypothetical protein